MADEMPLIKQSGASGMEIQVRLFDGRELQYAARSGKSKQSYSIDILSLQDKSKNVYMIAWNWLAIAAATFLLMLGLLVILPPVLGENKNLVLGLILLVGTVVSIFSLIRFFKNTSRRCIFYTRKAAVPVISLYANKPSAKALQAFVDKVEQRIKKIRSHLNIDEDKQLTGEMKMLRRLSDSGVISKKDYEAARAVLLSGFGSKK